MSKVTSKRQVTIPKELADRYRIRPGDDIEWIPAGSEIRVVPPGATRSARLGIEERLANFDQATLRRDRRTVERRIGPGGPAVERGWSREELHDRGRAG